MTRLREVHRDHEILLSREECQGGWELLYYSIFRQSDGYECDSGFTEDESDLPTYMGYMRDRIDAELAEDDPWGELSSS
jgi:hypothetical protein